MKYNYPRIYKQTLAIFLILINFNIASACSCISITNFCETTFYNSNIAVVEVISKNTPDDFSSFDVEVKQVISGVVNDQMISINYQPTSCTEFVHVSIGDEFIINFKSTYDLDEAPYPAIGFGNCSVNYLTLKNNLVTGRIYGLENTELSFDEFYTKLNECTDLSLVDPNETLIKRLFHIVENPVSSMLNIKSPQSIDEPFDIFIYNNQGKLIKTVNNISENLKTIDVHPFSTGLYLCTFKVRSLVFTKKFIKI